MAPSDPALSVGPLEDGRAEGGGAKQLSTRITRELLSTLFQHPKVQAQRLVVAQHAKVVELLLLHLKLPIGKSADGTLTAESIEHWKRCWKAVDSFLIGREIDEVPQRFPFSRSLRTVNFCVDLYEDHRRAPDLLPVERYLKTRQALLDGTTISVGRFQMPTNEFRNRSIDLQQPNGGAILRSVPAISSKNPARVFAIRKVEEIRTLFGYVVFAEEVQQLPSHLQPLFVTTGRRVVLKYFTKDRMLAETSKSREDPFKEIATLQWLQELARTAPMFPYVLDVLDDEHKKVFVKVEQDCGTVLIDTVTNPRSLAVRIPENWVVHILRQLVQGVHALHALGFVHLDLSLENCVCNFDTGRARIIDMGFLKRIPRDPKTGRTLPFPPSAVQKSGKVMALAPELFEEGEAIDATKVDVFALGSVCFCLTTKDCPFDGMEQGRANVNDRIWRQVFMAGRVGEYIDAVTAQNFPGQRVSPELQAIVSAAMCANPEDRCTLPELAALIVKHQRRFPPPACGQVEPARAPQPAVMMAPAAVGEANSDGGGTGDAVAASE